LWDGEADSALRGSSGFRSFDEELIHLVGKGGLTNEILEQKQ